MKKLIPVLLALTMLISACGAEETTVSDSASSAAARTLAQSEAEEDNLTGKVFPSPTHTADRKPYSPESKQSAESDTETAKATSTPTAAPTSAPAPAPTEVSAPTAAPAAQVSQPTMTGGSLPLDVATTSDQWWAIDSSDSAYWAVADNINAIRAAGGLGALSVDGGLSAAASSRCESFVAGGAFDHSGMTTKSEICASGGITSASAVCTAWQGSPDHYANIMRTDISSMGIGCWFCYYDGGYYAYWVVTFQ